MSIAKVVEISAASPVSVEDAILQGIERAAETLDQVSGAWIKDVKVEVDNGRIREWRVNMMLTFVLK